MKQVSRKFPLGEGLLVAKALPRHRLTDEVSFTGRYYLPEIDIVRIERYSRDIQ